MKTIFIRTQISLSTWLFTNDESEPSIKKFSSVSAQTLKCPGSEPFQLDSAQLGKFQLELITISYVC